MSECGCWNVFLWKGSKVLFIELKKIKKDKIRDSQIKFYNKALEIGLRENSFLVIEWDISGFPPVWE